MMHMTLYWGKEVTLLFDSWKTNSWTSYGLSLLACFLFSTFYQYLEDHRLKYKTTLSSSSSPSTNNRTPLLGVRARINAVRVNSAVMFGFNAAIGYFLMLAIMSFNGGVFLAIVLGLSVGYFVFRSGGDGGHSEVVVVDNTCACA
ncbi:hypothetical protein ACFE04_018537 [Oxalis oulophora]